jgi:hypothetical protein
MNNQKFRESYLYKNYFADFYAQQKVKVKEKIVWTIKLVETLQILPEEYFKHLETTDGLYEIRVKLRKRYI